MKKIIIPLFLILAAAVLTAEPMDLTVEEAVALGKENNLNLKLQDITVSQADRENRDRWNVFLPDMSATVTAAKTNQASSSSVPTGYLGSSSYGDLYDSVLVAPYDDWTLVGDLSAQLVLNPAIGNGIKALDLNLRTERLNREIGEKELVRDIEKDYFQLVQLEKNIELLEENKATTEQRYRDMQAMYQNGLITELDLLQTESGLASLTPALTDLGNAHEQLRMKLCMNLGLPLGQELNLTDEINLNDARSFDADRLVNRYLGDNLDIKSMILGKDAAANGRAAQLNQSLPSLILGWNYNPTIPYAFESDTWSDNPLEDNDGGAFSITLNIPIDDWLPHSGANNEVRAMDDTMASLDYQEKLLFQGTELSIRSSVMALEKSVQNIKVMEENVILKQKTYDMSWEQYRNGQMTATDLDSAKDDLLQAESNLLGEKYTYISTLLDLEYTVNRSLDNE